MPFMRPQTTMPADSPVEVARKAGPCGDGNWPGFDRVYKKISDACERIARAPEWYLRDFHIQTMADLGSGNEERMKGRLALLRAYGWV